MILSKLIINFKLLILTVFIYMKLVLLAFLFLLSKIFKKRNFFCLILLLQNK